MSQAERIVRVAARGDGATASGRHAPLAAPGDVLHADGTVEPGPHHAQPPCRHFGRCGGCQLQHLDEETLAGFVHDRVFNAAEGQGLIPERIAPVHLSPPNTRRRAALRAVNGGGRPLTGFNEGGSHRVVDMRECHVLAPPLFALVEPLRQALASRPDRYALEIMLALTDQGVDCAIKGLELESLEQTEAMLDFCREQHLARLTLDQGYGAETFWEPDPVTVTLSGVKVGYPTGAFLQATADGEATLVSATREWLGTCERVADLFAGLGTFAFALAERARVTAAEAARDAHLACRSAAALARVPVEAHEVRERGGEAEALEATGDAFAEMPLAVLVERSLRSGDGHGLAVDGELLPGGIQGYRVDPAVRKRRFQPPCDRRNPIGIPPRRHQLEPVAQQPLGQPGAEYPPRSDHQHPGQYRNRRRSTANGTMH